MTHERPQVGAVTGARGHLCCLFMNEYMCALRVECCRMWVLVWALHTWGHLVCCQEAVGTHASDSTDGANLPWSRDHGRTGRKRTEENFRVQNQRDLSEGHCPTFGGLREEHLALRSGRLVGRVLREEGRGQEGGGCRGSGVRQCRSGGVRKSP